MKLSLCAIVKNEESRLLGCLESVRGVADEIVVLDTGSHDRTVEIAKNAGAIVGHFDWCDDFAAARNEALKLVTGDWVLVLDADERLNGKAIPSLRTAIEAEDAIAVNLIRQEIGASQSPYSIVSRLFRRHSEVYFTRPYHATIDDSVGKLLQREPRWNVRHLDRVTIFHEGYEPGTIASQGKFDRAKAALERYHREHPNDPYGCSKLGALYVQVGEIHKGMKLLNRGLSALAVTAPVAFELRYHLGIAYGQQRQFDRAVKHYRLATETAIAPLAKLGAYVNLGSALLQMGNLAEARRSFETVVQIDPSFALGFYNLGVTLRGLGQFEAAIDCYRQAIALDPQHANSHRNLGLTLLQMGNVLDGMLAVKQAIALYDRLNPLEAQRLRDAFPTLAAQRDR
ncbi:glycosyl transferase group 2 family protein [Geitlerinema sp. FC II]|nr:tetratricopeptide repeat protein [Geitlerinema sp. CS-897]PPT07354.1 glycosyl transferase group 2 family protein [Geitlerinema sp. FC II]